MKIKCVSLLFLILLLSININSAFAFQDPGKFNSSDRTAPGQNSEITASFRIVFGVKDTVPTAWNGQVLSKSSQLIKIRPDRFRNHQYEAKGWSPQGIMTIKLGDPIFPNDYMPDDLSWVLSTRNSPMHGPTTEWHDHGQINNLHGHAVLKPIIQQPSIIVNLFSHNLNEAVQIKTIAGDFSFVPTEIIKTQNGHFINGNIKVELVPQVETVTGDRSGQQDFPSMITTKSGEVWVCWQEYDNKEHDQVLIRKRNGNVWGETTVLAGQADAFHTALATDSQERVWAVWSMQVDGRWDLYGRFLDQDKWSEISRLTESSATKNIYHAMTTDSNGRIWLVWQRTENNFSQIVAKTFDGKSWSAEEQLSTGKSAGGNNWWPALAAGTDGLVAVSWDGYALGSYDIYLRVFKGGKWQPEKIIAGTPRFEAHPTVAVDAQNRIWLSWDESGNDWGKDVGFLVDRSGSQLYGSRSVKVVCVDNDKILAPQQDLNAVLKQGDFWELPHLRLDHQGRPWLFVRHLVMREPDTPLEGPIDLALWEIYAVYYDGTHWSKPIYLPQSTGRNDMMPASAVAANGNVLATWATDMRDARSFQAHQLKVQVGQFKPIYRDLNRPIGLKLYEPEFSRPFKSFDEHEAEQVKKIRSYKIKNKGKTYSIYRGDLHRHTDISVDGNTDGSLLDAYRYARDAASLDFVGIADHTDAIWETYAWWRNQKVADLFQIKNSFAAFYGYERSVEYPNGHRNIFFPKRGSAGILPIGSFEARGYAGAETLYQYLHRFNGFSIPHTTGRTSGTDWRDNDPEVEPLLELYQGDRDSYEYPGSPRPFKIYKIPDTTKPIPRASSIAKSPSHRPLGFSWAALAKGYKLGFIASSDHISTHVSYACLIAEELSTYGLFDAVKARRAYASTDNIILDIRYGASTGEYLMGDIFESAKPVKITGNIIATGDILQVDIIKDNKIVQTYKPGKDTFKLNYVDKPDKEKSYFYVRIIQKDGEMAWGSPAWVSYQIAGL